MNHHTSHGTQPRGFTLIETIMYLALFGILMTGAVVAAYNLLEGGGRNVTAIQIQEEGTFLSRKINWALMGATGNDLDVSPDGTRLTVWRPDLNENLTLRSDGTAITLERDTQGALPLNSDRYTVTGPAGGGVFTVTPASGGRPAAVTASFLVEGKPFLFRTYVRQ